MGVTQGQDEANTSQSISPSSYSRSCCSYQGFRRRFSLLWHQHPVKPLSWVCGAIDKERSQVWAGLLGTRVHGGPRARHPVAFREPHSECREACVCLVLPSPC